MGEIEAGSSFGARARPIDGKAAAKAVIDTVAAKVAETGRQPGLATVLVGDNPASAVYVRNKGRAAKACGFHSLQHTLPRETTQGALLSLVRELNADPAVHGILVQLPLPAPLDAAAVIAAIDPDKDVDGLTVVNAGRLALGDPGAIVPCTPRGAMHLLAAERGDDLSGLRAVVVGRSQLVGLPMARLLTGANATVTLAHSRTGDLAGLCREADVLVAAVGRPQMVRGDWLKLGATVIDVGINRIDDPSTLKGSRLVGDVAYQEALPVVSAITPVPGGVGPMTIAMLVDNTLRAAERATTRA